MRNLFVDGVGEWLLKKQIFVSQNQYISYLSWVWDYILSPKPSPKPPYAPLHAHTYTPTHTRARIKARASYATSFMLFIVHSLPPIMLTTPPHCGQLSVG